MIFVTVGTQPAPFDRLLNALELLPTGEELVVQHGWSRVRPSGATNIDFLPYESFVEHVRRARAVIAHAGVGSVLVTIQNGKRPIVVPRLQSLGEHPDDHQHEFARRLEQAGLVTVVEDVSRLPEVLADRSDSAVTPVDRGGTLVQELASYLGGELRLSTENARARLALRRP